MRLTFHTAVLLLLCCGSVAAQVIDSVDVEQRSVSPAEIGSRTAKAGFANEEQIRDLFNAWQSSADAQSWLTTMGWSLDEITSVSATTPRSGKADVEVTIQTTSIERTERISIKLVSTVSGFNQIDKRWLATYAELWDMPSDVVDVLKLYVGETPPRDGSRDTRRMYLDEMDARERQAVLNFFTANKDRIVSDLIVGTGEHAADWMLVTWKVSDTPKWVLRSSEDTVRHYSEGSVELTRYGNLKIGRISMQRKGGDNGRPTARMLQFKLNPVELFDADATPQ